MNNPQSLRRRAERILPTPDSGGGVQSSTAQYAPFAPRVIAVIDHITGDVIYWQRIRYANRRVPKVGEYKRFGPIEKGYPLETAEASDYEGVKWGVGDIDKTTTLVWATFRHGAWIIEKLSQIAQFSITEFADDKDTIRAKTWDGAHLGSDEVQIAKPYILRRTPFDGATWNEISYAFTSNIQRTASKANPRPPPAILTEVQVIVPAYQVLQTIYAATEVIGGVSAAYHDDLGVVRDAQWVDLNVDGRSWARKA